uniref:Reverse transcriptase RNase H-like domain-containing protein n=1 Tax=Romanomermis culicivorax TaxID=13658 RepID=A0A915ILX3_ROMCU
MDASGIVLEAVLCQENDSERWVIAYNGSILRVEERKWCPTERECLAVVYSPKNYKHHLLGQKVIIQTDHKSLLSMRVNTQTNDKLKRWYTFICQFNHKLEYAPGRQNAMADFLSRKEEPDEQKEKLPQKSELIFQKEESKYHSEDEIINQNHKILVNQLWRLKGNEVNEAVNVFTFLKMAPAEET